MQISMRKLSLFALGVGVFGLLAVIYLQLGQHIQPCPLCLLQRYIMLLIVVGYFLGAIYVPLSFSRRLLYGAITVLSLLGLSVALWQVWLQHQPERLPSCLPDWSDLFKDMQFWSAIKSFFQGDCANVPELFLGFSLAQWGAAAFILLAVIGLYQTFRRQPGSWCE